MKVLTQFPIRWMTPILFLCFASVLTLSAWFYFVRKDTAMLEVRTLERVRIDLVQLQRNLENQLRQQNISKAQETLAMLQLDRSWLRSLVIAHTGEVVLSSKTRQIGGIFSGRDGDSMNEGTPRLFELFKQVRASQQGIVELSTDRGKIIGCFPVNYIAGDVGLRPKASGILLIHYDISTQKSRSKALITQHVLTYGLYLTVFAFLLWLYFHLVLSRRIFQLVHVCARVSEGDLTVRTRVDGQDEIALVGKAIDQMIEARIQSEEIHRTDEERLESLLSLHELTGMSEQELFSYALEESVKITRSKVGYLHFVDDDEKTISLNLWSRETMKKCTAEKDPHYPIEKAGIWADCIRLREPVIHNDYPGYPEKKGCPEGHFPILRHMSVPIFENGHIVAVIGVGNKERPYDPSDSRQLSLFFATVWNLVRQRRGEEERIRLESQLIQSQKMKAIGTLASGIAHDFNNILQAILGYTELAKTRAVGQEELSEDLEEIFKAGKRAKELTTQILTFSRETAKELKPLQIHLVSKEVLKFLRSSIPQTIAFKEDINPQSGTIMADASQIYQVMMNLCTNAYQAMRKTKKGVLTVKLERVDFEATGKEASDRHLKPGAYVKLSVGDNGEGIDQAHLDTIFEPYFTTKKKGEGTGLGLALVHGIVENHGGHISVCSELGKGTVFQIYLPRVEVSVDDSLAASACLPKGHERILVVDDETKIVRIAREMLEKLGYEVVGMTNPEQALETFIAHPLDFDLVIIDMIMPEMTGIEFCQRAMELRPDIPVVLCSGSLELIDKAAAQAMGIKEFILKPVTYNQLAEIVRKVLA